MSNHTKSHNNFTRKYSDRSGENAVGSPEQIPASVVASAAEADFQAKGGASLAAQDHSVKDGFEMDDEEALRRFRTSLTSNILPEVPHIEGYHLCWVPKESNNMFDTVAHRLRLHYTIVKPEELSAGALPSNTNRSAEFEGAVSFNELILMKLPARLYQIYATDTHHTQPLEQERVIKQRIDDLRGATDSSGRGLVTTDGGAEDGFNRLARKTSTPTFKP